MKPEIKKLLILNLPYLLFVWLFDKVGAAVRLSPGADASAKLLHLGDGFTAAFSSIAPSFHPADLALGIAGAVIVRLIIYTKGKNAKKYRRGTEYGSARWGGADDIKPYTDPVFENNIPLTQTERLTMNSRPKQPKYARNKNILVIGGSGSGKTRFFVKPSLMQCTSKDFPTSYIVTDPKGTLILETGKMLQRYKYRIKVLNTINFKKSMKYNPFAYLRSEKDILKLVNTIIANTKGDGEKSGEDFWVKAEKLYYTALIGYIWYEAPEDEKNFTTLLEMINASEAREDDEDFQNPVDLMFERLEEKDPEHFAVKQYKKYKLAAGGDGQDGLIRGLQRFGGGVQAVFVQKSDEALPRHLPEPPHEVAGAEGADPGSIGDPKRLGIMGREPLQNGFQPLGVGSLCRGLLFSLCNEQGQKAQQRPLDQQLIAGELRAAGLFHLPQTGGSLKIAQIVWGQTDRQRQPPALERKQVFLGAKVLCAAQKLQLKDEILVFHGLPFCLPQGVEGAGRKNEDVPHAGQIRHSAHLHQPRTALDKDQLHALLPVERHLREIPRDGAGIQIEWEPHGTVLLGFLQRSPILHRLTS